MICRLSRKKFQAQARSEVQTMKRFSRVVPPLQLNFITNYQLLEANTTMDSATASAESLRKQISATEEELKRLRAQLASVEAQDAAAKGIAGLDLGAGGLVTGEKNDDSKSEKKWPLSEEEYKRYGRQMIVPSVGIQGMFIERELIPWCGKRAMNPWLIYLLRTTPSQRGIRPHRWSGRSRLPSSSLSRWSRHWDHRNRRRR